MERLQREARAASALNQPDFLKTMPTEREQAIPPIPQHYRVSAVAARLGVSEKTIIRRVAGDPEVLVMTEKKRGTRRYQTYLIPESSSPAD